MAEYCPECLNKMTGRKHNKNKYVLSKDLDLCEGCGEWKRIVIKKRKGIIDNLIIIVLYTIVVVMLYIAYRIRD